MPAVFYTGSSCSPSRAHCCSLSPRKGLERTCVPFLVAWALPPSSPAFFDRAHGAWHIMAYFVPCLFLEISWGHSLCVWVPGPSPVLSLCSVV